MKILITKLVILIVLLAFLGCSSDSNKEDNSCTPTPCFNGGVSTPTCGCDCPEGFTGADCFDQKTPTKVLVTKIRVLSFLNEDTAGNSWDGLFSGQPDIYVNLIGTSGTIYSSGYIRDAVSNNSNVYDFIPTAPIELLNVNNLYSIELYDYDAIDSPSNSDDDMGSVFFVPFSKPSSLPKSIIVDNKGLNLKVEVFLTYIW